MGVVGCGRNVTPLPVGLSKCREYVRIFHRCFFPLAEMWNERWYVIDTRLSDSPGDGERHRDLTLPGRKFEFEKGRVDFREISDKLVA